MKKLSILLVSALLLIFFSSTIFAQGKKKGDDNKTVKYEFVWTEYWQDVYCDGDYIDYLEGSVNVQWIIIRKDGNTGKVNVTMKGEAASIYPPYEVFKIHEKDVMVPDINGTIYWHFNLIGNQGSHYVSSMIWDTDAGTFTIVKSICPGS